MANKWYQNAFRRHLLDMHIEDWNPAFLSEFSVEDYVANLKRAKVQAAMIYTQSHNGHCYFPTKVGHMHASFKGREDMIRRLVDRCHEEGISVVGYYSLIYNTYEEDHHSEWRVVSADEPVPYYRKGRRYGFCCPNNPEYRAFLRAQIDEIADYFTLEGMFFDMTFWPASLLCRCEHCKARYLADTGKEMPETFDDRWDGNWGEFMHLREAWMGEFAKFITTYAKEKMPHITVEHNYANSVAGGYLTGSTELVSEQCDYTGGDIVGDFYDHSFTAKYFYGVSKNQPFEYMLYRCDNDLKAHTISKNEEMLATEVMLVTALHGANFIIDAIDPVGTMDPRVYDLFGRVFDRSMPYEPYMSGKMLQEVGIYYATTGRYNSRKEKFNNKTCSLALSRTMIERHIPYGVVSNIATGDLSSYAAVFAPQIAGLTDKHRADLLRYVEEGGTLYFSGVEEPALLDSLLGATYERYTEEGFVYMAPTAAGAPLFGQFTPKYPLPTDKSLPVIKPAEDVTVLATMTMPYTKKNEARFASIHSNPPGIPTDLPALLVRKVGRGNVIWSAAPIEMDHRRAYKDLLMELLAAYARPLVQQTNAPRQVEIVTFRREEDVLISAVDLFCTDELLPVRPFTVTYTLPAAPKKVIRLASREHGDEEIPFTYADGKLTFTTAELVMFDMYRIVL